MSVQIKYNKTISSKNSVNKVLFIYDKYNVIKLKKYTSSKEHSVISELIKSHKDKKNFLIFDISSKVKITLVFLSKNMSSTDLENLGAKFYDFFKSSEIINLNINTDTVPENKNDIVGHFLHGIKLKSYKFEKYKSKKNKINLSIEVIGKNKPTLKELNKFYFFCSYIFQIYMILI